MASRTTGRCLRHVKLGGCVRDLELWNRRRQQRRDVDFFWGGTSVLGMSSFGIKKEGMSSTLMFGTHKTTALGTFLTSLGLMLRGTMARCQQCPILALTLAPLLALPIAAVAITRRRSPGQGRPDDVLATAKTPLPPPPSTNDIAARPPSPLKTTTAISMQP